MMIVRGAIMMAKVVLVVTKTKATTSMEDSLLATGTLIHGMGENGIMAIGQ